MASQPRVLRNLDSLGVLPELSQNKAPSSLEKKNHTGLPVGCENNGIPTTVLKKKKPLQPLRNLDSLGVLPDHRAAEAYSTEGCSWRKQETKPRVASH